MDTGRIDEHVDRRKATMDELAYREYAAKDLEQQRHKPRRQVQDIIMSCWLADWLVAHLTKAS